MDKLDNFNSSSSKIETASNRQDLSNTTKVKYVEETIETTTENLQKLIKKELTPKTSNALETTICGLIIKQMLEHPTRTAIIDGELEIDYKDLIKRAGEVAGALKNRGVKPKSLVGVCMERSWELVAVLIGVMQAGCAYVPLDPAYPQARIQYMLTNSRAVAAIVDTAKTATLCSGVHELL